MHVYMRNMDPIIQGNEMAFNFIFRVPILGEWHLMLWVPILDEPNWLTHREPV